MYFPRDCFDDGGSRSAKQLTGKEAQAKYFFISRDFNHHFIRDIRRTFLSDTGDSFILESKV